jgi:hypothetical protein
MRTLITTLLTLTLFAVPVAAQQQQKTDWGMGAAYVALASVTVADIETTARAIERGYQEQNPLLKPLVSRPGLVGVVNGALTASIALASHHLFYKKGHTRIAKAVIWTWTGIRTIVVVHNIRALNR